MTKERLTKKDYLCTWDRFEGDINDCIKDLAQVRDTYLMNGYTSVELYTRYDYENTETELYGIRPESDEEYNERMETHKKFAAKKKADKKVQEQKERELFLKLKEKYGNE
jgi:hypothetical protein